MQGCHATCALVHSSDEAFVQGWCRQTELLTSEVLERFVGLRESQAAEIVVAGMSLSLAVPGSGRSSRSTSPR